MARRKKNMTYEEELTYLDSEISKTEETLKALKTRKKELVKVKICPDCEPAVWNRGTGSQYLFPVFLSYRKLPFYTIKMLREDCIAEEL